MTQKITLSATPRKVIGKKVKNIRQEGSLPGVVYGRGAKPQTIKLPTKELKKVLQIAGTSNLIELNLDGRNINVLAHEPQYHPVTGEPVHIDFYRVRMDEKIKTNIPLAFTGESPAVEEQDGTLVTPKDELEVECLPKDLVSEINIDVSRLKSFDDQIKVSDIAVPDGIALLANPEDVIALVEPPRSDEELAELESATTEEEEAAVEKAAGEEEGEEESSAADQPEVKESEGKEEISKAPPEKDNQADK